MLSPSREERTVASALLLLSKTIPHQSPMSIKQRISSSCSKSEEESFSSKSHSVSSSTLTSLHGSSSRGNRPSHKLRIVAVVSRSHDTKFKVVRKKRSKVSWTSYDDPRKIVLALPAAASFKSDSSTEEVSCITSTISSAASSERSRFLLKTRNNKPKRRSSGMSRKAEAILKMLSSRGSSSEIKIRQALGDSPDTSKALRMLLKQEEVTRSGTGGRVDPYIYKIA